MFDVVRVYYDKDVQCDNRKFYLIIFDRLFRIQKIVFNIKILRSIDKIKEVDK